MRLAPSCSVVLKQQLDSGSSPERWISSGSAEDCNPWSATTVTHESPPMRPRKGDASIMGKGSWEGGSKKEPVAFHWPGPCQERRGVFLLPVGLCYITGHESVSFWSPNSILLRFLLIHFLYPLNTREKAELILA